MWFGDCSAGDLAKGQAGLKNEEKTKPGWDGGLLYAELQGGVSGVLGGGFFDAGWGSRMGVGGG